jgi:signal transduction histidine kinase
MPDWDEMQLNRDTRRQFLPALTASVVLLLVLLIGSGWVAIDAMRFVASDASRFVGEQQATARLIGEVQSEESDLSGVFYSLASRADIDRAATLKRLDGLETAIRRSIDIGASSPDSARWRRVRQAADAFIEAGRSTVRSGSPPDAAFYERHQNLLAALSDLASSTFSPAGAIQAESQRLGSRIQYTLVLLASAGLVAILAAILTVYFVNRVFRRLSWQASELAALSSRTMSNQEEMAIRISREMHDHFGQTLSAIEANLVSMKHVRAFHPARVEDCIALVNDAVENVREISQLLRPSMLDDFGLDVSLRSLAETWAERTGKDAEYSSEFTGRLDASVETQLFRIAQEALTNVARHSTANRVRIELTQHGNALRMVISDNGQGMNVAKATHGTGMVGMRARARVAGGAVHVDSTPGNGVRICAEFPMLPAATFTAQAQAAAR